MEHRNFKYQTDIEEQDDCIKTYHYAINKDTDEQHIIKYSPYRTPTQEEFAKQVDDIILNQSK